MSVNLQKEMERGSKAKAILENELYMEAYETIHKNLMAEWEASQSQDTEGREKTWMMLKALNEIQRFFTVVLETGKMAEQQLSILERTKQKLFR